MHPEFKPILGVLFDGICFYLAPLGMLYGLNLSGDAGLSISIISAACLMVACAGSVLSRTLSASKRL